MSFCLSASNIPRAYCFVQWHQLCLIASHNTSHDNTIIRGTFKIPMLIQIDKGLHIFQHYHHCAHQPHCMRFLKHKMIFKIKYCIVSHDIDHRQSPDTNCAVSSSDLRKTYYLTVLAEAQGINTRILIDTGSAITAIHQELWNKISTTLPEQIQKSVFSDVRTASGEIVTVLGASDMNFNTGNSICTFKTHVVPKLNYTAIIGKDFLQQNNCVIYFKSGYLKISHFGKQH